MFSHVFPLFPHGFRSKPCFETPELSSNPAERRCSPASAALLLHAQRHWPSLSGTSPCATNLCRSWGNFYANPVEIQCESCLCKFHVYPVDVQHDWRFLMPRKLGTVDQAPTTTKSFDNRQSVVGTKMITTQLDDHWELNPCCVRPHRNPSAQTDRSSVGLRGKQGQLQKLPYGSHQHRHFTTSRNSLMAQKSQKNSKRKIKS